MSYCELPQNHLGLLSQGIKKANLVWLFHHFKNLFFRMSLPSPGGQEEKGTTEDEMVGWHQRLGGHDFEQARGDADGQGSLASCSPWGCKESDMTERLDSLGQCTHECQQFWCCSFQGINHVSRGKSYLFLFIC